MTVTHIVLFRMKAGLDAQAIEEACQRVVDLRNACLHPSTQQPYIKSFRAGRNNSPERRDGGFTHAFVAEFETEEDRDYYVSMDPVHIALNKELVLVVEDFQVVDFSDGVL
ncbi:dabb-domain-containing protein [Aspergillus karnatakaensis]|uniref:Dabb family protein n=1 Tax=Aspergillus karnatakaensis TaxID=1810916 RepID=UPI003CCCDFF4